MPQTVKFVGVVHHARDVLRAIRPEHVERGARAVSPRDLALVLAEEPRLQRLFKRKALANLADEAWTARCLLIDFAAGNFTRARYSAITALVFAFRYLLQEKDLIPDEPRREGATADDRLVFEHALSLARKELAAYSKAKGTSLTTARPPASGKGSTGKA